jgi:hypothetical protein
VTCGDDCVSSFATKVSCTEDKHVLSRLREVLRTSVARDDGRGAGADGVLPYLQ